MTGQDRHPKDNTFTYAVYFKKVRRANGPRNDEQTIKYRGWKSHTVAVG